MPHPSARSPLLDRYVRDYEHGNHTSIDIAAPLPVVWAALFQVGLNDCRTTRALSAVRTVPGRLARGGAYSSSTGVAAATDVPLLESMSRDRFVTLDEVPTDEVTLGVIGQFWKPAGGTDAPLTNAAEFLAFDAPGYVKLAVNFRADRHTRRMHVDHRDPLRRYRPGRRPPLLHLLGVDRLGQQAHPPGHPGRRPPPGRDRATMKESHDGPSTVLRALFQVPVWLYQGHLGFLFFGRLIAIAHRGPHQREPLRLRP